MVFVFFKVCNNWDFCYIRNISAGTSSHMISLPERETYAVAPACHLWTTATVRAKGASYQLPGAEGVPQAHLLAALLALLPRQLRGRSRWDPTGQGLEGPPSREFLSLGHHRPSSLLTLLPGFRESWWSHFKLQRCGNVSTPSGATRLSGEGTLLTDHRAKS